MSTPSEYAVLAQGAPPRMRELERVLLDANITPRLTRPSDPGANKG